MTELLSSAELASDRDLAAAQSLQSLFASRRSIRRLSDGPFPIETRERLLAAVRHTPASFNLPPWRVVLVRDKRDQLWAEIADGFREALEDEQLDRYLHRLEGFAGGVAVALIFADGEVERALHEEKSLAPSVAHSYVMQSIGMVQLALWLAVSAEGMAASLQHWDHLIGPRLARFAALDPERFSLIATMPIGYAAEAPPDVTRADSGRTT